jgi:hypothetical protein
MKCPVVNTWEEAEEYLKRGSGVGIDFTNRTKRAVGTTVYLRRNTGYGGLNSAFLYDHNINSDTPVEIVSPGRSRYDYQVRFPDGYLLDVDERDICDKPQSL